MKKTVGVALAAAALAVAGVLFWLAPDDSAQSALPTQASQGAANDAAFPATAPANFGTGLEALPASLQGTAVDGEFATDAAGHLKITGGIRRIFDYFLSTLGEENLATVQARLRAYIRHKLQDPAATEAEQLLDRYLAYRQALAGIQQAGDTGAALDTPALRRQQQQIQALRRQHFTPATITAFFGDEELYDRYTLDRQDILQDRSLSAVQRAQRLAALDAQLPPPLQEAIGTITKAQSLDALTADWRQRGGSAAELRQIREKLVGAAAADRLEALDTENAAWAQRTNAWYAERAAILANRNLGEPDRLLQLEQARNARFDATERLRVEALERLRDRGETVPD